MSASSLEPLISEIKVLIGDGDLANAIERLSNYLSHNAPQLFNEILAQSARFHGLNRRQLAGSMTLEQFNVEESKVRDWLIHFVDKLPSKIERQSSPIRYDVGSIESLNLPKIQQVRITTEKILGINNLKQISWIERAVEVSKSVCRVLTPNGLGTGFLLSDEMIMTNHHVIDQKKVAATSVVEFDYQQDGSGRLLPTFRYRLDPARFYTNAELDFTIIGVKPEPGKPPLERWGHLQLNPNADPIPTEHVSIVQHPNGGLKQIVLTANWVIAATLPFLHYTTDTMAGSSGSPVFNDAWQVIAIHHASVRSQDDNRRYVNRGILMSAIRRDTKAKLVW